MSNLYSYKDFLIDILRHYTIKQRVYHPHLPTLIVEYVPIYSWSNPQIQSDENERDEKVEDRMKGELSHCDTVVSNVQLVDGIESGVGICDESQLKKNTRRDFMCIQGGYGYYNYKTKSARMKPKYPPGLYYQVQTCQKIRNEADICRAGDVLTMVIQRENMKSPGGR